jgi:hypothetical protein
VALPASGAINRDEFKGLGVDEVGSIQLRELFQSACTYPMNDTSIRGGTTSVRLIGSSPILTLSGSGDIEIPGLLVCLGAGKDRQEGSAKVMVISNREVLGAAHIFSHDVVLEEFSCSDFTRLVNSVEDIVAVFPKVPCNGMGRA